jgi:hypothetical protein
MRDREKGGAATGTGTDTAQRAATPGKTTLAEADVHAGAAEHALQNKGPGAALPAAVKEKAEAALSADFSDVRVHDDSRTRAAVAAMNARAFAYGEDIFLGPGASPNDVELMTHELTHVVQQRGGSKAPQRKVAVGEPNSPAEHEADAFASTVASGATPSLIIEQGRVATGQMTRVIFLAEVERTVKATAVAALGPEWDAQACPYIEQWFDKHRSSPAADLEKMARRYSGITATAARDYLPAIAARLATGIHKWKAGGDVQGELSAAGLPVAAAAAAGSQPVSATGPTAARKLSVDGGGSPADVARELGPGQPLDSATSQKMGDAFGQDFGSVRVHTGPVAARKAADLGASAFTVGSDVAFGAGMYQPGTDVGDALLAHELAHVAQQRRAAGKEVGGESAGAEHDADRATQAAVTRIADPTKTAPKAEVGAQTDFQLQRCSNPNPTIIAASATKGAREGGAVGRQHGWSTDVGDVSQTLTATRTLMGPQQSEAAAIALVKTNGHAGAVTLEKGIYFAYEVSGLSDPEKNSIDPPTCEPGVLAIITPRGVVYRPGDFDPGAAGQQKTSNDNYKNDPGDPFQGYKDALNGGKDLDNADPKVILPAFEAAMLDTALAALKESERGVKEKQPKFTKGLGGVPDAEVQLIKDTAIELLPLQKHVEHAISMKEGGLAAARTRGATGQIAYDMLEASKKEMAEYSPKRNAVRQRYPMLARFNATELEAFTKLTDEERIKKLNGEFPNILSDIADTRNNLVAGKIDLWESTEIIEATMLGLGITAKEKRNVIAAKKKEHEKGKTITAIIKAVINIGLGIGAALIGGPVGLAMAGAVLASDVEDAITDTDQYFVKKAASNTDIDPNKSILDPDSVPGWGWLIMSWAAVGLDLLDVKAAVKAIEAGEKSVGKAAEDLGKLGAAKKGMAEGELVAKLKVAAGELKSGETLTEVNKAGVAARLGVSIEIDKSIAETEVRVGYKVDKATGKVEVTGMTVGVKATIDDVLAHQVVLKLMRRYEGVTGKIRQLWDKLVSLAGKKAGIPFEAGSQAYNSWLEVQKLPAMIEARSAKYGPHLTKEAEAALRQDIEFLESELAHHQEIVEKMVAEAGDDFVAKTGDSTLKCTNDLGYSLPDVAKKPPLTAVDIADSSYYYKIDKGKPVLVKKAKSGKASLRAEIGADGKPTGKFLEGDLTREEKGKAIVASMPKPKQSAFEALVDKIAKQEPGAKVVPIDGMAATKKTLRGLIEEFGDKAFKAKLEKLLTQALEKKGVENAAEVAKKAVATMMDHEILVIRGTEQLRAYGYRPRFISKTGQVVEDDLHHMIPLYLGGDHTVANLIDIDPKLHDAVHELVDSVKYGEGVTLAPSSIQNAKDLTFSQGAAILHADGTITYDALEAAAK